MTAYIYDALRYGELVRRFTNFHYYYYYVLCMRAVCTHVRSSVRAPWYVQLCVCNRVPEVVTKSSQLIPQTAGSQLGVDCLVKASSGKQK